MTKKLKIPGDYPQFTFRISEDEKDLLSYKLDILLEKLQNQQKKGEKLIRKNDLILRALNLGMKKIEEEIKKRA